MWPSGPPWKVSGQVMAPASAVCISTMDTGTASPPAPRSGSEPPRWPQDSSTLACPWLVGLISVATALPDITVGTLGRAVVFRSRPVVRLKVSMAFTPSALPIGFNSIVNVRLCFEISSVTTVSVSGLRGAFLNFTLDVDVGKERKRLQCSDERSCLGCLREWSSGSRLCENLLLMPTEGELHEEDCFSNASVKVSYQLQNPEGQTDHPQPILDHYAETFAIFQMELVVRMNVDTVLLRGACLEPRL
ncbi:hypothetical protein H8959_021255 [Pygathrix nigripes]